MPTPGLGHKSYLQYGIETTFGTAVAATRRTEIVSWNVPPIISVIADPSLNNAQSRRALYQGGLMWKGSFVVRLNYEGMEELARALVGTAGYTSAVIEGSNRDHIYKESATLPSYTMEAIVGDIPVGKCFQLTGVKITDIAIRGTAGTGSDAMVMVELTVIGKDCVSNATPTGSLTAPAIYPVLFHQGIVMDDGTADSAANIRIRGFEVTLQQPHAEDRFYLGSVNIDEPVRQDFLSARFRLTQEFVTRTQYDAARAFTQGSPRLLFQHPTALTTVTETAICNVASSGVFTITRAAGSFITDGVKVGHSVTSAVFPVGTRVTAVVALTVTVDTASTASLASGTISFTSNREWEFRMGSANIVEWTDPVEGYGIIIATATWEGFYDPTDLTALYMRNRNAQSALP